MRGIRLRSFMRGSFGLLATVAVLEGLDGCGNRHTSLPSYPLDHNPVVDSLIAVPDAIGPSDSTVVTCYARDVDGDSLVYDWDTDARLEIKGNPAWMGYLNQQRVPYLVFYNANLSHPINDSAWVYCEVRDLRGGGSEREVFIILRSN